MSKKPILCCIEGGGVRQIENSLGVLMAMYDQGIVPDYFMGSSAGAIMSALMASKLTPQTLWGIVQHTEIEDLFVPQPPYRQVLNFVPGYTAAFYDPSGTYALLKEYMTKDAEQYAKVAVTKMRSKENSKPLPQMCKATPATVMASFAIPCFFPPVVINGAKYEDGGVLNILPLPEWEDAEQYEHIYIILCNDDVSEADDSVPCLLKKGVTALLDTMNRERTFFNKSGWKKREFVTTFETPTYPSSLLDWSKDHGLVMHAYDYALNKINSEKQK